MKFKICAIAAAIILAGCASKPTNETATGPKLQSPSQHSNTEKVGSPTTIEPVINQRLSTNFQRRGIKVEWDCKKINKNTGDCDVSATRSIEVTAYAPSFGNTENNRERAFTVAEMNAKGKLRHFIQEDISSTRVVNTFTRNLEKARDIIQSNGNNSEDVQFSEDEQSKSDNGKTNLVRENMNKTVQVLTESIHANAQGILRGVYVVDSKVVDRQTVSVTIRWDARSDDVANTLRRQFSTQ